MVSFRQNSLPLDHHIDIDSSENVYIGKSTKKSEIWKRYQAEQEKTLKADMAKISYTEEETGEQVQNGTVDSVEEEHKKQQLQLTEQDLEIQDNVTGICCSPPNSQVYLPFLSSCECNYYFFHFFLDSFFFS